MLLFALPSWEALVATLASLAPVEPGQATLGRCPNGELHATIETPAAGRDCLVLGSVAPPDEALLATLLLGHTLAKEGARRVIALLPYLGYARQDRAEPGRSLATAWAGALIQAAGFDEVVTVDVHSPRVHQLFALPVRSLSPAPIFAGVIASCVGPDTTVVAPDEGALERAEALRRAAGIKRPLVYFTKKRTVEGGVHSTLHGAVGRHAIVVDDILDTGGTLVAACQTLQAAGVETIMIVATHGLFTGTGWQRLPSLGVTRIYCADTVPLPPGAAPANPSVVSMAPLLADWLRTSASPERRQAVGERR